MPHERSFALHSTWSLPVSSLAFFLVLKSDIPIPFFPLHNLYFYNSIICFVNVRIYTSIRVSLGFTPHTHISTLPSFQTVLSTHCVRVVTDFCVLDTKLFMFEGGARRASLNDLGSQNEVDVSR